MTSASFQRTQLADELWGMQREDTPLVGVPGAFPDSFLTLAWPERRLKGGSELL